MPDPRDPLLELLSHTLSRVVRERGRTRLSFQVGGDESACLEIASRATLNLDRGPVESGSRSFIRELKRLRGEAVADVRYAMGESMVITLGKEAELTISLRRGDFEGDVAASLDVEGMDFVNFHGDGLTRLALHERKAP